MNDISSSELYDGLVGHGLFAEKIPNFLTSENFLEFTKTLNIPSPNIGNSQKPQHKDYIRYDSMRNTNTLRHLAIPEPFAYVNQCKIISTHWKKLQEHFDKNTNGDSFKISRIHLRKLHNKPKLFEMNYKNFFADGEPRQDIIIKSKYIAYADISNCFSSMYSHAISWALVGKEEAKKRRKPIEWFNQIDTYTQSVKFGETNGILIGPHSSNLISEIILIAIDGELSSKFKYIRNIDDYICYANSYEEAENFFLSLSEKLKKYELVLNDKKSKIIPLPKGSLEKWVTKLNHFNFIDTYSDADGKNGITKKELNIFLDFSIGIMLENDSNSAIINYAIKIIASKHLGVHATNYYIKQIHHLVLLFPYLVGLLEKYVFEPHSINKEIIKNIAKDIYLYGFEKHIYEACSYALYWSLRYDFNIEIDTARQYSLESMDCIFMLIAFLYDKKYKSPTYLKKYKDKAKELAKNDFDRYWLFIFEILSHKDLNKEYKIMKKKKITFVRNGF